MGRESMSPRERWEAVLSRRRPDRVPTDYWTTSEAHQNLKRHLCIESDYELYERLHIDRLHGAGGRYVGPPLPENTDHYGCRYRDVAYAAGSYHECVFHPLAEFDTIEAIQAGYTWPSADWWDLSGLPDEMRLLERWPVHCGASQPFYVYSYLRGIEQSLIDLVERPEMVDYCLGRIVDFDRERMTRVFEAVPGQILMGMVADDFGSQEGLLFSREHIVKLILPHLKRAIDLIHGAGAYVFHHNDGAIRAIIPDMIDAGIDLLNPVQWRCADMDREGLVRDFGDRIVFHGGMDNQQTLAFGSVADVVQEVRGNIRILGAKGRYVLAPCHNIQAVSPPENIVAMYEAAFEGGRL